jgi:hypothetical protein
MHLYPASSVSLGLRAVLCRCGRPIACVFVSLCACVYHGPEYAVRGAGRRLPDLALHQQVPATLLVLSRAYALPLKETVDVVTQNPLLELDVDVTPPTTAEAKEKRVRPLHRDTEREKGGAHMGPST